MNWADWLNDICILRVMGIHWSYQNLLFWAGIVWYRLSANQIIRCFKLKKLKSYMRCQVDFLLPLRLQNMSYYFGLCWKILLANQFRGFFYFWLVWLVNLNTRSSLLHCTCYILELPRCFLGKYFRFCVFIFSELCSRYFHFNIIPTSCVFKKCLC